LSRGGEIAIVVEGAHPLGVLFATDEIVQQPTALAFGHGQDTEAEVQDVNGSTLFEVPAMPRRCWQRHLAGGRDDVLGR
jgi:hypothetical protein